MDSMKKIALLLFLIPALPVLSQNLADNGSLENTGPCPIISSELSEVIEPWESYFGTPDYYHQSCGFPGSAATTNNTQPFDGQGFAGIFVYGDTGTAFQREYLHGELTETLEEGKYYRVTFYVKPLFNDEEGISYAINNLGLLLTDSILDSIPEERVYEVTPQVLVETPVQATSYWTAVCGVIKATGNEQYITIGNFNTDIETQVQPLPGAANPQTAYYMIDYVQVVENDLPQLPADTIICEEERIDLNLSAPDINVIWNRGQVGETGELSGPTYTITQPGIYTATVSNINCEYTDTIVVEPSNCDNCKLFVPNAFTPNDPDGTNDIFRVNYDHTCRELLDYRISIFDRWGQKVFESTNIEVSWDGKIDGDPASTGVYIYNIEYEYPLFRETVTETLRGAVHLIK